MSLLTGNSVSSGISKNIHTQIALREHSKLHMYICVDVTKIQEKRKIVLPFFQKKYVNYSLDWTQRKQVTATHLSHYPLISVTYFELSEAELFW